MTNNVRFIFSVGGHYIGGLQLALSNTNMIGDTKGQFTHEPGTVTMKL
jgi:hypothetical protein